jgi:hypothetical protein
MENSLFPDRRSMVAQPDKGNEKDSGRRTYQSAEEGILAEAGLESEEGTRIFGDITQNLQTLFANPS